MRITIFSPKAILVLLLISIFQFSSLYSQHCNTMNQEDLDKALNEDGTIQAGASGSFNVNGYEMRYGKNGEPIFRKAGSLNKTTSAVTWNSLGTGTDGVGSVSVKTVSSVAVSSITGDIYIGGNFQVAGDIPANRIAKWDGTAWSALGDGVGGAVNAIAISGSNVYVGGQFTTAGGFPANNIAKWDGTAWSALGSGAGGTVKAIAISGTGDIYVGGSFTTAGGSPANRIAIWNGTAWSALGSGVDNTVNAIAISGSNVYVGGSFTTAGDSPANRIAIWNGTAWSALGDGANNNVNAIAISGTGDIYVGGQFTFTTADGYPASGIAKWDGTSWSALGDGVGGAVYAIAISGNNVYVGGQFGFTTAEGDQVNCIVKWDGTAWSALGDGVNTTINAVAVSGSNVYVGGSFNRTGGSSVNNIAKWDGTAWLLLKSPGSGNGVNGAVSDITVSGSNVYVGGSFTTAGGYSAKYIAKWNGTAWSALGSGVGGIVKAIAISGTGDIYVGGSFTTAGGSPANRIAKWNGTAWSALGSGVDNTVNAIAISGTGDVYVGGEFTSAGGSSANHIAKWDGTAWSALSDGIDRAVYTIAISGTGDVYVGGLFSTAGPYTLGDPLACNIAKWDGTAWSPLGKGLDNSVNAIAISGNNIYVGGQFSKAGDSPASRIAKWDGTAWSALGSGVNNMVSAIVISGNNVYVGGQFTTAGGSPVNRIAKWNGTVWEQITDAGLQGTNSSIYALAINANEGKMYVGGSFVVAGTTGAYYVASFSDPDSPLPVELASVSARAEANSVILHWTTATEVDNYGFEVERMCERGRGYEWVKIGFVSGHGNSNSPVEYSYVDNTISMAGKYSYRLKQIDNDGKYKYYDAVSVRVDAPKEYQLLQNSPNPFNPSTAIKFELPENTHVSIKIYDQLGREVTTLLDEVKPSGSHILYWNGMDRHGSQASSGIYLYRLTAGTYSQTRKMILLK